MSTGKCSLVIFQRELLVGNDLYFLLSWNLIDLRWLEAPATLRWVCTVTRSGFPWYATYLNDSRSGP